MKYHTHRFRFVQDSDSLWYAIPEELRGEFDAWEEFYHSERPAFYNGQNFDRYRLRKYPSNYTFVDLKED
jgi:hypothetical protein